MIIDLPSTNSSAINKAMVDLRERGGANTQGRVLTLVIVTDEDSGEDPIAAANGASFEHPCRVIVLARGSGRGTARMDAQIRVGGDAGASEVVVLRLYGPLAQHGAAVVVPLLLPDAPVVAWWPGAAPEVPAEDPVGALAQRRITDAAAVRRPTTALANRISGYRPGDTDLSWTRLTTWRGLLAAALDQPPHEKVTGVTVSGASDSVSADLLAGWLALRLRCPVRRQKVDRAGTGLRSVLLERRSGSISLVRPEGDTATLTVSNQPGRQLSLPRRNLRDCIAEELRRLDADEVYADVLATGLGLVASAERAAASGPTRAARATSGRASTRPGIAGRGAGRRSATGSATDAEAAPTAARRGRRTAAEPAPAAEAPKARRRSATAPAEEAPKTKRRSTTAPAEEAPKARRRSATAPAEKAPKARRRSAPAPAPAEEAPKARRRSADRTSPARGGRGRAAATSGDIADVADAVPVPTGPDPAGPPDEPSAAGTPVDGRRRRPLDHPGSPAPSSSDAAPDAEAPEAGDGTGGERRPGQPSVLASGTTEVADAVAAENRPGDDATDDAPTTTTGASGDDAAGTAGAAGTVAESAATGKTTDRAPARRRRRKGATG
ncbi:glucose-6-phosphate dehydrogenase assembly protein OpcA [Nakamurella endophytica]|uniref:Glucose-6-phosphate dehydrogenase assembly protein OpcA n=1 Tax=Nakamurella endophytica TaxID=1748367 RepID=A0A917SS25_9ACTN|nr:glucose-6-phosphate dehydrogenase assembly protein OpcA [Nakamurella endophytica]GGL94015.1 hypothetical protein GCM10011594_12340 [Nakamurella endophytica]